MMGNRNHSIDACWVGMLMLVVSCKSPQVDQLSASSLRQESYANYHQTSNESGTFILCVEKVPAGSKAKVYVLRHSDNQILWQTSLLLGYAKWKTNDSLEVLRRPGTIKKDQTSEDFIQIVKITDPLPAKP
jgi:hypothetical protein